MAKVTQNKDEATEAVESPKALDPGQQERVDEVATAASEAAEDIPVPESLAPEGPPPAELVEDVWKNVSDGDVVMRMPDPVLVRAGKKCRIISNYRRQVIQLCGKYETGNMVKDAAGKEVPEMAQRLRLLKKGGQEGTGWQGPGTGLLE